MTFIPAGQANQNPMNSESVVTPFGRRSQNQDNFQKADGFINIYLPTKGGKKRKLGSIALRKNTAANAKLVAWLEEDPTRITQLLASAEVSYNSAEGDESSEFELPGIEVSAE